MNGEKTKRALVELSFDELVQSMQAWGEPAFRADQIWKWVYTHYVESFEEMTDLPKALRERLADEFHILPCRVIDHITSKDGLTEKVLLQLADGETVESVLMRYERRRTACISTQVGCPIRCAFCATGQAGLRRNLTAGEIVAQALLIARLALPYAPEGERPLTNIVYMGMGEPLLNLDATLRSVDILTDGRGFGLGARHITISTAGIVPGILRLAGAGRQIRLAISLHAPNDALRDRLVPVNRTYPIAAVMEAVRTYVGSTGRRVTFEYVLIDEVNDSIRLARELAELLAGIPAYVNLIPVNPVEGTGFRPSPRPRVQRFVEELERHGISCTLRLRRGIDVQAGCGQLRSRHLPAGGGTAHGEAPNRSGKKPFNG